MGRIHPGLRAYRGRGRRGQGGRAAATAGILCHEPGEGLPRFGFHVFGFDLSARNVAAAIAEGRAYADSSLIARILNGDDTFLLPPLACCHRRAMIR